MIGNISHYYFKVPATQCGKLTLVENNLLFAVVDKSTRGNPAQTRIYSMKQEDGYAHYNCQLGKGVLSAIVPKEQMPMTEDGEYADLIMNSSTMYNRENPYQLIEMSLTRIIQQILRYIDKSNITPDEGFDIIIRFIRHCNPSQADELQNWVSMYNEDDKAFLLQSLILDDYMYITVETMKNVMTIDDLSDIYKDFPFLHQTPISVCITDSNGNIRRVIARRPVVMGKEYILRLKQYAEEKFSATSLSSTNIRNENAKSKANREYRTLYSHTPIRAGEAKTA